jgi:hypothetical protein
MVGPIRPQPRNSPDSLAEEEGFELSVPRKGQRFSRLPPFDQCGDSPSATETCSFATGTDGESLSLRQRVSQIGSLTARGRRGYSVRRALPRSWWASGRSDPCGTPGPEVYLLSRRSILRPTWEMSVKPPRSSELALRSAIATALLGVAGLTVAAAAQTPPAASAIARTVVAGTKLPSLGNTPLYFRAMSVSIPPGQKISLSAPNGILLPPGSCAGR